MTLYEIDKEILDCIDQETGEIVDADKLTALQMQRDEKREKVALWIKNLRANAAACHEEKRLIGEREDAYRKKADSLEAWLDSASDGEPLVTGRVEIKWKKSSIVHVWDMNSVPDQFVVRKESVTADKNAIRKALKDGEDVPGCKIVVKNNIQIK